MSQSNDAESDKLMSVDADAGENEPGGLLKATSVVSSMTLLSRISGLARDISFAHWFGAGIVMDAFFVAFKIPNLLRRFFAEGAFSQAFVPVISEYRANSSPSEIQALLNNVTGTLGLVVFGITALGVVAAPLLIMVFAPGFLGGDGRYEVATEMLRFTFPYLFFISMTALAGGILNTYRRFAVPAFTPVLLNLVLIGFAAWVAPQMERPAMGLALGVFAGVDRADWPVSVRPGSRPKRRWSCRRPHTAPAHPSVPAGSTPASLQPVRGPKLPRHSSGCWRRRPVSRSAPSHGAARRCHRAASHGTEISR